MTHPYPLFTLIRVNRRPALVVGYCGDMPIVVFLLVSFQDRMLTCYLVTPGCRVETMSAAQPAAKETK